MDPKHSEALIQQLIELNDSLRVIADALRENEDPRYRAPSIARSLSRISSDLDSIRSNM